MKVSFLGLLTIVFIVLKLTKVIDWSWWLVVSPSIVAMLSTILFITLAIVVKIRRGY